MEKGWGEFIGLMTAIIVLAAIAVVVVNGSNSSDVLKSFFSGFSTSLSSAEKG